MSMAAPSVLQIVPTSRANCPIRARFPGSRFLVIENLLAPSLVCRRTNSWIIFRRVLHALITINGVGVVWVRIVGGGFVRSLLDSVDSVFLGN